jgi:hypothetical protein
VQQQAFGACNGCDPPDDSGPIVAMRLRLQGDTQGVSGRNAFPNGANPSLTVEVVSQALIYDTPSTPAHILRVSVQTDKTTGLLNCGQGTGANAVSDAIQFGCPLVNTAQCQDTNYCAPFKIYDPTLHPLGVCNPLSRVAGSPFADCVATNSENGTKRLQVVSAIANRIVAANGDCQANYWHDYAADPTGHPIQGDTDPRALTFVITAPADLSSNSLTVPIRNFATFYITGWDTGGGSRQCTNAAKVVPNGEFPNDPFPGSGKDKQLGAIWGHWIQYTDPNAIGNGTPGCPPSFFGVCVPVLSR